MKKFSLLAFIAITALAILSLAGCDSENGTETQKTLVSIKVTTQPTKTEYVIGESLDISGMIVTATYSDGSTGTVSVTKENISGFDSLTPGEKTLTVTYDGKIATFNVTVVNKAVVSIKVTTQPTKTVYAIGESLDINGMIVTATYNDNTKGTVSVTAADISGFDSVTAEIKTLTVTYGGKIDTFTVTVKAVSSIAVTTQPTKVVYVTGENLDIRGLVITATYSDGTTGTPNVTEANITGFDTITAGSQTLTVTYGGKTDTFTVTVNAPGVTFTSIADFKTWLGDQADNTAANPYIVKLNISLFNPNPGGSLSDVLNTYANKYVYLDLSSSTFPRIADSTFENCTSLISITIPASATSIRSQAFICCTNLTAINVYFANTEYSSQYGVMYDKAKTELVAYPPGKTDTTFTIPSSVTSIGSYAFYGCKGLTSVTIPSSVISIKDYAFHDCASLTSIIIPDSVIAIWEYAFKGCTSLTSTTIGSNVYRIENYAFQDCTSLTSITIPSSVNTFGIYSFLGCTSLTSITISRGVTSIGFGTFYNCTSLTSIIIPSSVKTIGNFSFSNCTSLTSVTFETGSNITSFGDQAFPQGSNGAGGNSLKTAYATGKAGTYVKGSDGNWSKQ